MTRTYRPTPTYDFLKHRRIIGIISAILCLGAVMLMIYPGPNYGIDFSGGTNIVAKFSEGMSDAEIRNAMTDMGIEDASVLQFGEESHEYIIQMQAVTSLSDAQRASIQETLRQEFGEETVVTGDDTSGDRVYVRLPHAAYGLEGGDDVDHDLNAFIGKTEALEARLTALLNEAGISGARAEVWGNPSDRRFLVRVAGMQAVVEAGLSAAFGDKFVEISRTETVGPRVGQQLRNDAIKAVLVSMIFILIYIAIRFDMRYAPGAVIAQFHDVFIVVGIFVIFRIEFSLTIVAALLTIVGYSLNDTIVNFDRIRENIANGDLERETLLELVNRSINECLSRTLLTGGTTLLALTAILVFGGPMIRSFALAMALGVIVGTYSSIYISNPLMIWMSNEMDKREAARKPVASRSDLPV